MTARVSVVVKSKGSSNMGMETKKDEHEMDGEDGAQMRRYQHGG